MDKYTNVYRINFLQRRGFRYATNIDGMTVTENKKLFYSDFEVKANSASHAVLTVFYGGLR